jgi:hypothetical protein
MNSHRWLIVSIVGLLVVVVLGSAGMFYLENHSRNIESINEAIPDDSDIAELTNRDEEGGMYGDEHYPHDLPEADPNVSCINYLPEQVGTFNTDAPNTTVTFRDEDYGIEFEVPFNEKWVSDKCLVEPYEYITNDVYTGIMFGPVQGFEGGGLTRLEGLTLGKQASIEELDAYYQARYSEQIAGDAMQYEVNKIGNLDVIKIVESGFCDASKIIIVGKKHNYILDMMCDKPGRDMKYLESIAKTIKFID